MSRPAIAHIRLDAFRHNYRIAKQSHGGKALAVIKANAYGHGAIQCAQAIENEADGFAVAAIEEALQLREARITAPILLLEGFFEAAELPVIVANDFWIVIHHLWQVEVLLETALAKPLNVWLKLDSGMHRVGLSPADYSEAYSRLSQHVNVAKLVLMTHFANADNLNSDHTQQQVAVFQETITGMGKLSAALCETSLANSAGILSWPQAQGNWSRPGIMLYGASPVSERLTGQALRAVMQLTSRIISIRKIAKGESTGYGSIFTAERDTKVGVVACGYADGYPRSATTGTPIAVDGQMTRLIGRVSMDMLFVDLTDIPNAEIGSQVELWGDQVSANEVAQSAGTIAYELFCNVKRVQFKYSDVG
ncbi:alanine racemase [Methyloradius palustris]|uniref:Alanine racemase n=1 Tax=Methyloradius palustris TaxID=2778876 RepID=A0A8D5FZB4_9PROT|nr:alanine racemase [Methyloradius palustris]BCM25009.1 alanine racemase [Methyloradius palustris]